ncbi:alpha/beta-hydrolase [Ramicandelaber brevisporus]|nr:alpha/beta-hydrolase [Ramicandelaber brevisporus]
MKFIYFLTPVALPLLLPATALTSASASAAFKPDGGHPDIPWKQPPAADIGQLRQHARWAAAAYCDSPALMNWTCDPHCLDAGPMRIVGYTLGNDTGLQAYVGVVDNERRVVAAIRGSRNWKNWLLNIRFGKADYMFPDDESGAAVHRGFAEAFELTGRPMIPDIMHQIELLRQPEAAHQGNRRSSHQSASNADPVEVVVTGHSLGGAIATMMALELERELEHKNTTLRALNQVPLPPVHIITSTFGAPRIGNRNFALLVGRELCDADRQRWCYRVTLNIDLVSQVPPQILQYIHGPHEVWAQSRSGTTDDLEYWFTNDTCVDMGVDTQTGLAVPIEDNNCQSGMKFYSLTSHRAAWDIQFNLRC